MDAFNWLHLSDLHWGRSGQKHLWPGVREPFFDSLATLHAKSGPWHAVFFSGDLVQRGRGFVEMEQEVLEPLWEHLAKLGSAPVLLAVPGNHDLQRPAGKTPVRNQQALVELRRFHRVAERFWEDLRSPHRRLVDAAFAEYAAWWANCRFRRSQPMAAGMLPGDYSTTFTTDGGHRVGIVGLNSTFLQLTGENWHGRLSWDVRQFHAACEGDGPNWTRQRDVCLLLTHHGPEWLDRQSRELEYPEVNPAGRFVVHIFGHMHEEAICATSTGAGHPVRHWQGASLFGLEHFVSRTGRKELDRRHGFSAGRLLFRQRSVELRHWPLFATFGCSGWRFVRDEINCRLKKDGATRDLIRLESKILRFPRAEVRMPPKPVSASRLARDLAASIQDGELKDSQIGPLVVAALRHDSNLESSAPYDPSWMIAGIRLSDDYYARVAQGAGQGDWQRDFAQIMAPTHVAAAHSLRRSPDAQAFLMRLCQSVAKRLHLRLTWPKQSDRHDNLKNAIYRAAVAATEFENDEVLAQLKRLVVAGPR